MTERVTHWRVATSPVKLTSDGTSVDAHERVGIQ